MKNLHQHKLTPVVAFMENACYGITLVEFSAGAVMVLSRLLGRSEEKLTSYRENAIQYYKTKIDRKLSQHVVKKLSNKTEREQKLLHFNCEPRQRFLTGMKTAYPQALKDPALRQQLANHTRQAFQRHGYETDITIRYAAITARDGGLIGIGYVLNYKVLALPASEHSERDEIVAHASRSSSIDHVVPPSPPNAPMRHVVPQPFHNG